MQLMHLQNCHEYFAFLLLIPQFGAVLFANFAPSAKHPFLEQSCLDKYPNSALHQEAGAGQGAGSLSAILNSLLRLELPADNDLSSDAGILKTLGAVQQFHAFFFFHLEFFSALPPMLAVRLSRQELF